MGSSLAAEQTDGVQGLRPWRSGSHRARAMGPGAGAEPLAFAGLTNNQNLRQCGAAFGWDGHRAHGGAFDVDVHEVAFR